MPDGLKSLQGALCRCYYGQEDHKLGQHGEQTTRDSVEAQATSASNWKKEGKISRRQKFQLGTPPSPVAAWLAVSRGLLPSPTSYFLTLNPRFLLFNAAQLEAGTKDSRIEIVQALRKEKLRLTDRKLDSNKEDDDKLDL